MQNFFCSGYFETLFLGSSYVQGCHATWRTRKSQGISKLTRKAIEFGSRMCIIWAQNHIHVIFLRIRRNNLLFNLQKSTYCSICANCSSDYHGILQSLKFFIEKFYKALGSRFQIFGFSDLMVISNNKYVQYYENNKNFTKFS